MAMALSWLTVRISWCGTQRGTQFIAQSDEGTQPRLWFGGGKIMIRKVWKVSRGPWPCSGPNMKINFMCPNQGRIPQEGTKDLA